MKIEQPYGGDQHSSENDDEDRDLEIHGNLGQPCSVPFVPEYRKSLPNVLRSQRTNHNHNPGNRDLHRVWRLKYEMRDKIIHHSEPNKDKEFLAKSEM
jgi:hypothetical protein